MFVLEYYVPNIFTKIDIRSNALLETTNIIKRPMISKKLNRDRKTVQGEKR